MSLDIKSAEKKFTYRDYCTWPEEERWDLVFIAEYPNPAAFVAMIRDPVYREAVKHRTAAVAESRLIRLSPLPLGEGFGGVLR